MEVLIAFTLYATCYENFGNHGNKGTLHYLGAVLTQLHLIVLHGRRCSSVKDYMVTGAPV